ncbi:hypothetical protein K0M31_014253, partial [Melipona bicolor]
MEPPRVRETLAMLYHAPPRLSAGDFCKQSHHCTPVMDIWEHRQSQQVRREGRYNSCTLDRPRDRGERDGRLSGKSFRRDRKSLTEKQAARLGASLETGRSQPATYTLEQWGQLGEGVPSPHSSSVYFLFRILPRIFRSTKAARRSAFRGTKPRPVASGLG